MVRRNGNEQRRELRNEGARRGMFAPVEGWRSSRRRPGLAALALAAAAVIPGCGGSRQDAHEPSGNYRVDVVAAHWQLKQSLAQASKLTIAVRNAGNKTIPDVAVTIGSPDHPRGVADTAAGAFSDAISQPGLASTSRPIWIVDPNPVVAGANIGGPDFSPTQENTGPPGAGTAYTNTWALGALPAGHTATFVWHLTAIKPGTHTVAYVIAAGLNGKAKAVDSAGKPVTGEFKVNITSTPSPGRLDASGKPIPYRP
ncbi:MAG: hypothetical protein ACR2HD_01735 [Solirubrobacteraceae bacterium]|nr:MAG: hypothetical protein DLM63_06260 [Solirubrobacterales bacterium]